MFAVACAELIAMFGLNLAHQAVGNVTAPRGFIDVRGQTAEQTDDDALAGDLKNYRLLQRLASSAIGRLLLPQDQGVGHFMIEREHAPATFCGLPHADDPLPELSYDLNTLSMS